MTKALALVVAFTVFGLDVGAEPYFDCFQATNPVRRIAGCTNIIEQKEEEDVDAETLAGAYSIRGTASASDGDLDRAIEDLTQAIKISPEGAHQYRSRGMAYLKKADYRRAVKDFSAGIEINPTHAGSYNLRGLAHLELGEINQALKDFQKVLEIDPSNVVAKRYLAVSRLRKALQSD